MVCDLTDKVVKICNRARISIRSLSKIMYVCIIKKLNANYIVGGLSIYIFLNYKQKFHLFNKSLFIVKLTIIDDSKCVPLIGSPTQMLL